MTTTTANDLKQKVLDENRRVHALENAEYLDRHPEQTNAFQMRILNRTLDSLCSSLPEHLEILDVGCGTGYMTLPLLERGCHVTGVDLSDDLVSVLGKRIPDSQTNRVHLIADDIETFLDNNSKTYDAVVCSAILHHLYDYENVLGKLCDKVNPGGRLLIFFEPLKQKINSPLRFKLHRLLGNLDEWAYRRAMKNLNIRVIDHEYETADYQRQFGGIDPVHVQSLLTAKGMTDLKIETYCARRTSWAATLANTLLGTANTFNFDASKSK